MSVLAARIRDAQIREQQSKLASDRRSLIGSGDRSERIRTYNYPQGRITDHRINLTLYKIEAITDGDMEELINALSNEHQADLLAGFAELLPTRHAAQREAADQIDPAFLVPETVFTTITVNKTFRTAAHRDAGDFSNGLSNLLVLSNNGNFTGKFSRIASLKTVSVCAYVKPILSQKASTASIKPSALRGSIMATTESM